MKHLNKQKEEGFLNTKKTRRVSRKPAKPAFSKLPRAQGFHVWALEPNSVSSQLLKAAVLRNGLEEKIHVLQAMVSDHLTPTSWQI